MRVHSFYGAATGLFTGRTFATSLASEAEHAAALKLNTPAGCAHLEGKFDHLSQRVDVMSGKVVDYQPPQPTTDHEWDAQAKRWKLKAAVVERQQRLSAALAEIARLEASQARPIREAALGIGGAHERIQEIDAQIAELRKQLA